MPRLVGLGLAEAEKSLQVSRLVLGPVAERPSEAAPGIVIAQAPPAGTKVPIRSRVAVVVSGGPEQPPSPTPVPDLLGLDLDAARERLAGAGLRLGGVGGRPSSEPAGTVIHQSPQPEVPVDPGSEVYVVLAMAEPPPTQVPVPDLASRGFEDAQELLAKSGLAVGVVGVRPSPEPAGTVIDQSPDPATLVDPGSEVSIVLAAAQVPPEEDVAGQEEVPPEGEVPREEVDGTGGDGAPVPPWVALVAAVAVAGLAWAAYRGLRRPANQPSPAALAALGFQSGRDLGRQTVEAGEVPVTGLEVRLQAVVDPGAAVMDRSGDPGRTP